MSIIPPHLTDNRKRTWQPLLLAATALIVAGLWFYTASSNSLVSDELYHLTSVFGLKEVGRPVPWSPYKQDYFYEYSKTDPAHIYPRGLHFTYLAKYWSDLFGYDLIHMRIFTLVICLLTWLLILGYLFLKKYIVLNPENVLICFILFLGSIFIFLVSQYFRFYAWYGFFVVLILILYNEILISISEKRRLKFLELVILMLIVFYYLDSQHISLSHLLIVPIMIMFPFRTKIINWIKIHETMTRGLIILSILIFGLLAVYSADLFGFKNFLKNQGIVDHMKLMINSALDELVLGKKEGGSLPVFAIIPHTIYVHQWFYALIGGNIFFYLWWKSFKKLSEFDKFLLMTFGVGMGLLAFVQHSKIFLIHHSYIFGIVLAFLLIKTFHIFPKDKRMQYLYVWLAINCLGISIYVLSIFATTNKLFAYVEHTHQPRDVVVLDLAELAVVHGNPNYEYISSRDLQKTEESERINPSILKFGSGRLIYQYTRRLTPQLLEDLFKKNDKPHKYIIVDWYDQRKYQGNDSFLYRFLDANVAHIKKIPIDCRNCQLYKVDLPAVIP